MSNQIVPTKTLQAVVDYLGTRPYTEVKTVLENLLANAKPEVLPEPKFQMKDAFFGDSDMSSDLETK